MTENANEPLQGQPGALSPQAETPEDTKRLFDDGGPQPDNRYHRSSEGSNGARSTQINIDIGEGSRTKTVKELAEELPPLHPNLYPFRDPDHDRLLGELDDHRILVLTSYQECAAYAAAYSIATDGKLLVRDRKALFPSRRRDRDRVDVELLALTDEEFLGEAPQILLIEISSKCAILDSALQLAWSESGRIRNRLQHFGSYLILAVNEDLFTSNAAVRVHHHPVSHLRYLFARDLSGRAEELERRLLAAVDRGLGAMALPDLYHRVADRLAKGLEAFEDFLRELEESRALPLAERKRLLQPVTAQDVFRDDSEIHRAAAFVATYFPEIGQYDFHRLVLTLLGEQTTVVQHVRQVIGRDGGVVSIREESTERWAARWESKQDQVFLDCHLAIVAAPDSPSLVDFSEPYLRRELRDHFERYSPWYLRRQCQVLQDSGIFFALDLSPAAIDALVRLFVDRAVVDPAGFGTVWLIDLVSSLKIQLKGDPPAGSPEAVLAWLLDKLAAEAQLRAHFHGRLVLLIREMLDREALRPMVREFFEVLIAARQHEAVLDVVLELARRLRFAPHFESLLWMRRLLDQGSAGVRRRTVRRLLALARDSGARIYEFLATIRSWLPEAERPPERFSVSNRVALEFPFAYCIDVTRWLPERYFGAWPSRHPLFYALPPSDTAEARAEIAGLVDWILDPRGAVLETADKSDPTRPAEAVRIGFVADLIEHWSWVLDSGASDGAPDGRALFQVILEEVHGRIGVRERAWLQRSWLRRQDEYLAQVTKAEGAGRTVLGRRRTRLDQLKRCLAELAAQRQATASASAGGVKP